MGEIDSDEFLEIIHKVGTYPYYLDKKHMIPNDIYTLNSEIDGNQIFKIEKNLKEFYAYKYGLKAVELKHRGLTSIFTRNQKRKQNKKLNEDLIVFMA